MNQPISRNCQYKTGYKYQLTAQYMSNVGFGPEKDIDTFWVKFYKDGTLILNQGFASDGPSGPTIDTKNFMCGAFEHDALYKLMRMGLLPYSFRIKADRRLRDKCREDGMSYIRSRSVYIGVRVGGGSSAKPKSRKRVMVAP